MSKPLRLLIVDDSRAAREQLSALLSEESYIQEIRTAKHGLEALSLAEKHRPDVVLLDQNMPGLTGAEVARRLKAANSSARIIFVSADPDAKEMAMAAGAEAFFVKGVNTAGLIQALRAAHSPIQNAKRSFSLNRKEKDPPKLVPWLTNILMLSVVLLVGGIVLTRGYLLVYISLFCGLMFFVYAMKYYASMIMILAATGGNGTNGNGNGNHHGNGNEGKIAKRLNALRNGNGDNGKKNNGLRNGNGNGYNGNGNGNGAKERLKKQPFVSIQLPMFNEHSVVDRLLQAATSLDYDNYEILVADDSSDSTVNRLEKWAKHPKVKVSHRINRSGFKGAALHYGLEVIDPRTEFIVIFDADFVPPPQIVWQFLDYFYGYKDKNGNGNGNGNGYGKRDGNGNGNGHSNGNGDTPELIDEKIGVVQGYQWHMLNADENWLTKGVRAEYSGSYVVERSSQELVGSMKMISGSVYMIRADVLREVGWGTSITEDWELTLKLYIHGYKVLYTPFIQAPSECVATFGRLLRQRMRWAEGHTYNVRKYFMQVMTSKKITRREKLEFVYFVPYYLQSIFFVIGTVSWFVSETILHYSIPYWTSLLGWSLVFANMGALILMNLSGLFIERGVKKEWAGVLSAVAYGTLLVPFQGYAALKGLLEVEEGGWFRTPKTGTVTKFVDKLRLGGKMGFLKPKKRKKRSRMAASKIAQATGIAILLSDPGKFINGLIGLMIVGILALSGLSPFVGVAEAAPDIFYLHDTNTTGITPSGKYMNITEGSGGSTIDFNTAAQNAYWYADVTWPTGNDDATIAAGDYDLNMYFNALPGKGSGDYPSVAATNTSATTPPSTSHTLSLPSGISSGDLLIALLSGYRNNGGTAVNISWPSGWTEFFEQDASAGTRHLAVAGAYRQADGSEGASITVTTNIAVRSAHNAYRITGAADPATQAPEAAAISYTSLGTSIDPPSLSPTGGAKDYLWLAAAGLRGANRTFTGGPASYTNGIQAQSTGGGAGTRLGSMRRALFAASENPSAFTINANSNRMVGVTIAVHPSASVDIQVTVSHTAPDGSGATTIVSSSTTTIDATTADPYTLSIGSGALQTFTSASLRRLRVQINIVSVSDGGNFILDYDGTCASSLCSNLSTPVVVVPELGVLLLPVAILLPPLMLWRLKKRKRANRLATTNG